LSSAIKRNSASRSLRSEISTWRKTARKIGRT